jgi:hypothetical protein
MSEGDLIPKKGASEMDFSEAPIFKMYGPSPSMGDRHPKWGHGATIPVRPGQRWTREDATAKNKRSRRDPNRKMST